MDDDLLPDLPKLDLPELPDIPEPPDPPLPDLPDIDIPKLPKTPFPEDKQYKIPSPFGAVSLPAPKAPDLKIPKMTDRRKTILKHTIAIDISGVIGFVPVIGDIVADVIEDAHGAELRDLFTPAEQTEYLKFDKVGPSSLAAFRTFARLD